MPKTLELLLILQQNDEPPDRSDCLNQKDDENDSRLKPDEAGLSKLSVEDGPAKHQKQNDLCQDRDDIGDVRPCNSCSDRLEAAFSSDPASRHM